MHVVFIDSLQVFLSERPITYQQMTSPEKGPLASATTSIEIELTILTIF